MKYHTPVLVPKVLHYLLYDGTRTILDGTVGSGGHAQAILDAAPRLTLIGTDRDPTALQCASDRLARYGKRVRLVRSVFSDLEGVLGRTGTVDGVLLDLGVSSMQLDERDRGFGYSSDGPLDMRMSQEGKTAGEWIKGNDASALAAVLRKYGEVRRARAVARGIKSAADSGELDTTADLKKAVVKILGKSVTPSVLSRIFQAVRIQVNSELAELEAFLGKFLDHVNASGRVVVISYHSLEDRAVKTRFREESAGCSCPPQAPVCVCGHVPRIRTLTHRVVKPSTAEVESNPRSRSARLRAAEILSQRGVH